jgi:hypothetical protein
MNTSPALPDILTYCHEGSKSALRVHERVAYLGKYDV